MKRYIIVKYADLFLDKRAPIECSVYGSYTANLIGIKEEIYTDLEIAERDRKLLHNANESVNYGVVELE